MSGPHPYRKKPVVIEAAQWDGTAEDASRIIDWVLSEGGTARFLEGDQWRVHQLKIDTLHGTMRALRNDWIIKGVKGEFYPCRPSIFDDTYEDAALPKETRP